MSRVYRFDFTISKEHANFLEIKGWCEENCKKWVFQLEKGKSGYEHYQGRVSLKEKRRLSGIIGRSWSEKVHWSITSSNCKGFSYVMKIDTRLDGPWKDDDRIVYIPRQYRGKLETLRPFQRYIIDNRNDFNDRRINLIICKKRKCW